ncbi:MAG: N-acetylmuramoyl-L-alanine amidase [Polyangiaceae bacterium]|nr:N-acetylmuramoyl-L-alanine amidase [Polyangiaceae bacterium]
MRSEGARPARHDAEAAARALPPRAEVVARADVLALRGSRNNREQGAADFAEAAQLRTRLWRIEGRQADALEALELLGAIQERRNSGRCDAATDRALLQGELSGDPIGIYEALYVLRTAEMTSACAARIDRILAALAAFRPPQHVLDELRRQAGPSDHGEGSAAQRARSSEPVAATGEGPVVVPEVGVPSKEPARITKVEQYRGRDAARVVVFVTHPTTYDVGALPAQGTQGPRLYVDVHGARYSGPASYEMGGMVERVRIGHQPTATRIVLDVQSDVYRKVFYLPEPFRLIIDVARQAPQPTTAPTGPRVVRRVVLDPGHGGHDPGAIGPIGLREKDVTLDIAHRAAPVIARELGIVTLLTRDADEFVALDERAARANAFRADLFVSIHCNASDDPSSRGLMSFVLDESRDLLAAGIAARENSSSTAAADELANALSRVLDQRTIASSSHFAALLERASVASLAPQYGSVRNHGVRRAGFYVLAGAQMPAVLFEVSFISNPLEELRLNTADYRQRLSDAVVNAVRAYRDGL